MQLALLYVSEVHLQGLYFLRLVMNSYYLYIQAGAIIDESASFYKVAVGTSRQANRDYLFLLAHAEQHAHYFELWSADVAEFVNKIAQSLCRDSLPLQLVKARDLVRCLKAAESMPLSAAFLHNQHQLRNILDTNYRIFSNISARG